MYSTTEKNLCFQYKNRFSSENRKILKVCWWYFLQSSCAPWPIENTIGIGTRKTNFSLSAPNGHFSKQPAYNIKLGLNLPWVSQDYTGTNAALSRSEEALISEQQISRLIIVFFIYPIAYFLALRPIFDLWQTKHGFVVYTILAALMRISSYSLNESF